MKNKNMKHKAEYRPLPEQTVVFIDRETRPSDACVLKLPQVNEVCVIRAVMTLISLDTGERGTGLYLNGYTNPTDNRGLEYCYESERFVPLALAKIYCAKKITAGSANVSPVPYNGHMIKLHMDLIKHFKRNNVLCESHPDGNGIDAAIPAPLGNVPVKFRYMEDKVSVRCFSPLRIRPEHRAEVLELVLRLNDQMGVFRYNIDFRTNLAYCSIIMDIEKCTPGEDRAENLIGYGLILVTRLFNAMTRVMYGMQNASKAIKILEEDDWESTKAPRVDPINRIEYLTGGNPELN